MPTADQKIEPTAPKEKIHFFKIPANVAKPFKPYVQRFLRLAYKYNQSFDISNLTIKYGQTAQIPQKVKGSVTIGVCSMADWKPTITIDKKRWKLYSYYTREILLYHELGHCLLNRDHEDKMDSDNMPGSIMHSTIFSDWYYHDHRPAYLKELFTVHLPAWLLVFPNK